MLPNPVSSFRLRLAGKLFARGCAVSPCVSWRPFCQISCGFLNEIQADTKSHKTISVRAVKTDAAMARSVNVELGDDFNENYTDHSVRRLRYAPMADFTHLCAKAASKPGWREIASGEYGAATSGAGELYIARADLRSELRDRD